MGGERSLIEKLTGKLPLIGRGIVTYVGATGEIKLIIFSVIPNSFTWKKYQSKLYSVNNIYYFNR